MAHIIQIMLGYIILLVLDYLASPLQHSISHLAYSKVCAYVYISVCR